MGEEAAEASSAAVPTVLTTAEMLAVWDAFRAAKAMAVVVMGMSMEHGFSECVFRHNEISVISKYARYKSPAKNIRRDGSSGLSLGKGDSPGVGRLRINSFFGRFWVDRSLRRDFRLFQSPAAPWSNPNAFCWRSA